MIIEEELTKRFIKFRKKYIGSRQSDAAEICECTQKHISEIEAGKTSISLNIVILLYQKKKLNPEWFFTGLGSWQRGEEPKGNLLMVVADLKGEVEVMKKYIEQMQKIMKKVVRDVYDKK